MRDVASFAELAPEKERKQTVTVSDLEKYFKQAGFPQAKNGTAASGREEVWVFRLRSPWRVLAQPCRPQSRGAPNAAAEVGRMTGDGATTSLLAHSPSSRKPAGPSDRLTAIKYSPKRICGLLHSLAGLYYDQELRGSLPVGNSEEVTRADRAFSHLHELSRKKPSKQKCLEALSEAKKSLVAIEGVFLTGAGWRNAGGPAPIDERIISTLRDVCPPAAAAYAQGVKDLEVLDRASWRGPATELP